MLGDTHITDAAERDMLLKAGRTFEHITAYDDIAMPLR